jgi:hypothetical protein
LPDPRDYVRLEIAEALKRKKTVIPALVRDAPMPAEEELPDDIARLATRPAVELRDSRWFDDVRQLMGAIQPPTQLRPVSEPTSGGPPPVADGPTSEPRTRVGERDGDHRVRTWLLAGSFLVVIGALAILLREGSGGGDDHPTAPPQSPAVAGTLVAELGGTPLDAVIEADGSFWVVTIERDVGPALVHVDGTTLSEVLRRRFRGLPVQVAAHEGVVWVPTREGILLRFDPGSSEPTELKLGGKPERALVTSESLWVLLPNTDTVVRVDSASSDETNDLTTFESGGDSVVPISSLAMAST